MHHDVTSCVICISNNVELLEKRVTKILPKRLHCDFKRSLHCNKKVQQNFFAKALCKGTLKVTPNLLMQITQGFFNIQGL